MVTSGKLALSSQEELLLFLGFFVAFAIKLALFPVHTWLPDAYTAAPAAGHHDARRRHGEDGHL